MYSYIQHNKWRIIEEGFHPDENLVTESLLSIGNGCCGQRANFEEKYSGKSLRGSYVAGVYYPDKTRVGWWKNGYPEYFAKIPNAANWIGIDVFINDQELDLATVKMEGFCRELDMRSGLLTRRIVACFEGDKKIEIIAKRFLSISDQEIGVVCYETRSLNFSGKLTFRPYIDGDVKNSDSNYDEKFWIEIDKDINNTSGYVYLETKKTAFRVCTGMNYKVWKNKQLFNPEVVANQREKYISSQFTIDVDKGDVIRIEKYAGIVSSLNYSEKKIIIATKNALERASAKEFPTLLKEQESAWERIWKSSDIQIEGDVAAQQGIRFNIFHLKQTYNGNDDRLNIGPKGFTGEKYGGVTYWDTEAFCLPFFLSTAPEKISKNLLLYRYKQLDKAIENASKLGFKDGAALYPMVTINGEECHNEWEITFEEIHRNGAIAYAIYNYIEYTGDKTYLAPYGFEVLLAVSRFWSQRVNWSEEKQKFVILGVTGPNEYENNVNNNFHTNYMAVWTLKYTLEVIDFMKKEYPYLFNELISKTKFHEIKETSFWKRIIRNMYFPYDRTKKIYLQQDGFFDKVLTPVKEIDSSELPINKKWSWDRILRSCYIKQADTLQSIFWFEDEFSLASIKRHFDFYEPLTVHESSLSPSIHTILAAYLGKEQQAYGLYLRTARLDLDNYNQDTEDGLHITSMGGTWMAFVQGFGGMRVKGGKLQFNPIIPESWKSYSFRISFRGTQLELTMNKKQLRLINHSKKELTIKIRKKDYLLKSLGDVVIKNS